MKNQTNYHKQKKENNHQNYHHLGRRGGFSLACLVNTPNLLMYFSEQTPTHPKSRKMPKHTVCSCLLDIYPHQSTRRIISFSETHLYFILIIFIIHMNEDKVNMLAAGTLVIFD